MYCFSCAREVDDQWKFCRFCGERMAVDCPACGARSPVDSLFCHECGAKMSESHESPDPSHGYLHYGQPTGLQCPRCRTANEPESEYCYNCGLPLDEEPAAAHAPASYARPVGGPPYQSPRTRANWTVGLLVATCITYALHITLTFGVLDLVWQFEAQVIVSSAELDEALLGLYLMSFLLLLVYIPTVVLFLMWMHRATRNLRPLRAYEQRFSPAWAVGWWFVPIMWFFRPYQVMAEIWRGSNPDVTPGAEWKSVAASPLLGWWWTLWLVSNLLSLFAEGYNFGFAGIFDSQMMPSSGDLLVDILLSALTIAAGILAILVVLLTTHRQEVRRRRTTAG